MEVVSVDKYWFRWRRALHTIANEFNPVQALIDCESGTELQLGQAPLQAGTYVSLSDVTGLVLPIKHVASLKIA